ncbi:MAG: hypothetical protein U0Q19_08025 [Kineosporiaceae bacterium]
MAVTITFPEFDLPAEYPVLHAAPARWDEDSRAVLAARLGLDAPFEDHGLWHVARTDRRSLEIYAATDSFRLDVLDRTSELDGAAERGLDEADAVRRAEEFLAPFRPRAVESRLVSVVEAEVLVSREPRSEPRRYVTGTQVNLGFAVEGTPLLGPGAKMQATVGVDGETQAAYLMWRQVAAVDRVPGYARDELADRLGRSRMFAQLSDDTARVEITTARAGLLCLPPTERQLLLPPAIEVRGTVSTEAAPGVGFSLFMSAADTRGRRRQTERTGLPARIVA